MKQNNTYKYFKLDKKKFSERFKLYRDERADAVGHCTQTDVADYLHVSQQSVSGYEKGEVDITFEIFINLAYFLDVHPLYLAGMTDKRGPFPNALKKCFQEL